MISTETILICLLYFGIPALSLLFFGISRRKIPPTADTVNTDHNVPAGTFRHPPFMQSESIRI